MLRCADRRADAVREECGGINQGLKVVGGLSLTPCPLHAPTVMVL